MTTSKKAILAILVFILTACSTVPGAMPAVAPAAFNSRTIYIVDPDLAPSVPQGISAIFSPEAKLLVGSNISEAENIVLIVPSDEYGALASSTSERLTYAPQIAVENASQVANANVNANIAAYVVEGNQNIYPVYYRSSTGETYAFDYSSNQWPPTQIMEQMPELPEDVRLLTITTRSMQQSKSIHVYMGNQPVNLSDAYPLTMDAANIDASVETLTKAMWTTPDNDVVFFVSSQEDAALIVQALNRNQEFNLLSGTQTWSGAGYINLVDETGVYDSVLIRKSGYSTPSIVWRGNSARSINLYTDGFSTRELRARYANIQGMGEPIQLIIPDVTAEESAAFRMQWNLLGKSDAAMTKIGNYLIFENPGGNRLIFNQLSNGWYGFSDAVGQARTITEGLAQQGYALPEGSNLMNRVYVQRNGSVWMDLAGIQQTSPEVAIEVTQKAWADDFAAFMANASDDITAMHIQSVSIPPQGLVPSTLPAARPLMSIPTDIPNGSSVAARSFTVTSADAAASEIASTVAVDSAALPKMTAALSARLGKVVTVLSFGFQAAVVLYIVDEYGDIIFQWGPNVQTQSMIITPSEDQDVIKSMTVPMTYSNGMTDTIVMQIPNEYQTGGITPDLYKIWDEAQTEYNFGNTDPWGWISIDDSANLNVPGIWSEMDMPTPIIWHAVGTKNDPKYISFMNVQSGGIVIFSFSTRGWKLDSGDPASLAWNLDTKFINEISGKQFDCQQNAGIVQISETNFALQFAPSCDFAQ